MKIPHPIPYQGSKRCLASLILNYFPSGIKRLIEPFAGSAAISLAASAYGLSPLYHLNDLNKPLILLWEAIINNPEQISKQYESLWEAQHSNSRKHYNVIREQFNKTGRPDYFLYLLTRCVKAAVRYNPSGKFNQSPDNRRTGTLPKTMKRQIFGASSLLKDKIIYSSLDYKEVLQTAQPGDLVYLDPPYQGVCSKRDSRYFQGIVYDEFVQVLEFLNKRAISFLVSYDGKTGNKSHGKPLPRHLNLVRVELKAGRSSQATLLGRSSIVYESLYISPALLGRIDMSIGRH
ncbi:DNA adenine methylase [Candidatus Bathyarchaeota archaeon]|nr:DNA adenine methylase [Candidatus Bathyarchaeota archaeon]